jgi:hypothetical protein
MEIEEAMKGLEEAESKLSPFDRHVAMTMAILAALLAAITMFSHRAHTEALSGQEQANALRTEANIYHTRASDQWAYYQSKNTRAAEYEGFIGLLDALAKSPQTGDHKSQELSQEWGAKVQKYEGTELPQLKAQATELSNQGVRYEGKAGEAIRRSYAAHERGERLDIAELGLELGLVLCSLAVLTKAKSFWFIGIAAGVLGLWVALTAALIA